MLQWSLTREKVKNDGQIEAIGEERKKMKGLAEYFKPKQISTFNQCIVKKDTHNVSVLIVCCSSAKLYNLK